MSRGLQTLLLAVMAAVATVALAQSLPAPEAFSQPMAGLSGAERQQFFRGRGLVRQSWVAAPSRDQEIDGLGPLYNRLACISCHPRNGRGQPPAAGERMLSMLVRLSVSGKDAHGGPKPHPAYGGQLNEEGVLGVEGEGTAEIRWVDAETVTLTGGEQVRLRRAELGFRDLAYGSIAGVLTSPRVGQQMVGMGYFDAISAASLERMAREPKADGVRGRVNRVWNPESSRREPGRFGYKANMPTLRAQSAGAFQGDLGITSALFPEENCTPVQSACRRQPSGGRPELTAAQLDDVEFYLAHLELPPRRGAAAPGVRAGEASFAAIGCAACHRPVLVTDSHPRFPRLSGQTIRPYTDLLVHDLGPGLSDGRPDYLAKGREWRTAPLWGLGLTRDVAETVNYLHDGRARSLTEAILWHGGEAKPSRDRFADLPRSQRQALLEFLEAL